MIKLLIGFGCGLIVGSWTTTVLFLSVLHKQKAEAEKALKEDKERYK